MDATLTSNEVPMPHIATLHACGHWTLTLPAYDEIPEEEVFLHSAFADREDNGAFVHSHVFSSTPCMEFDAASPKPLDHNVWDTFALDFARAQAAEVLAACCLAWDKVREAEWGCRKYLAECVRHHDKYLAELVSVGDIEEGERAFSRFALRAQTWLDRAAEFWDRSEDVFSTACIALANEHLNTQGKALEIFVSALEETQQWRDNRWNLKLQAWLDGIGVIREGDFDCDHEWDEYDSMDDVAFEFEYGYDADFEADMHEDSFFASNINASLIHEGFEEDETTYAPSSVAENEYDDDDASSVASKHSITVGEVLDLHQDQDLWGPPYNPNVRSVLPAITLDGDAQDVINEFIEIYDPCAADVNANATAGADEGAAMDYDDLVGISENVPPSNMDDNDAGFAFGSDEMDDTKFSFGPVFAHFAATFGTGALEGFDFDFEFEYAQTGFDFEIKTSQS